jgi:hypothetical protein
VTARTWSTPRARILLGTRRKRLVVIGILTGTLIGGAVGVSLAFFSARSDGVGAFGTKAIFPAERLAPVFVITDSSSGSEIDRSNPLLRAGDGRITTTDAWSAAFASGHYVDLDFNASLASGVAVSGATLHVRYASTGIGTACYYLEVRRISTGAVLGTAGSSSSPLSCVTGTGLISVSTSLTWIASTADANDLQVRLFGRESGNASFVLDLATVDGSTPYQAFTLAPVMVHDAADGTPRLVPWGLALP